MFVRIVHHWCKPEHIENGRRHIDGVGTAAACAPGFLFRFRMENPEEPLLLTTFTAWADRGAFGSFQNSQLPSSPSASADFFERTQDQVFDVAATAGRVPTAMEIREHEATGTTARR
ncbi:hypothetical protein NKI56_21305 [Mesorhizobium sp. M0622]|uniref:hypothetical protein n=1 Tax=unclassified Mesorhizobium TaxID=325217 RepID=UPI003337B7B9